MSNEDGLGSARLGMTGNGTVANGQKTEQEVASEMADLLGLSLPKKVTTVKPNYPPMQIMRAASEGIEPIHRKTYLRTLRPSSDVPPK